MKKELPIIHNAEGATIVINDYSLWISPDINLVEDCTDIWESYKTDRPRFTDYGIWKRIIVDIGIDFFYLDERVIAFHSVICVEREDKKIHLPKDLWNCFDLSRTLVIYHLETNNITGKDNLPIKLAKISLVIS